MKSLALVRRKSNSRHSRLEVLESRIAPAAIITGSLTDNTGAAVLPGGTIHYTEIVANTGDASALNLQISHVINNANFVAGSLNISPLAGDDSFTAVGNTPLVVGGTAPATPAVVVSGNLFANDTEFANDLGALDTFALTSFTQPTSGAGSSVTVNSDGTFTYTPKPGFSGTDTFTYTITDDGVTGLGAANSAALTSTGTVTITVSNLVWYVDSSAGVNGNGTATSPFNVINATTLNGASDVDGAGDYIYLFKGSAAYSGGLALEANQHLIGEGVNLVVGGFTLKTGTVANRPTLSHNTGSALALASGNEVRGLNVTNTAGSGITGSAVGTLTMADFDVTATGGSALSVSTSGTITVTGTDNDLTSTNGTALSVTNVGIGAAGLLFKSINAGAGANNGIVLDTTGSAGGLTVAGTGAPGSGGTISGKTGADGSTTSGTGIYLNSTSGVSLNSMSIQGNQNYGIRGINVTGFTLNNSSVGTVTANGTSSTADVDATGHLGEGSVRFLNLLGTATISNSTLDNGFGKTVAIANNSGTLNLSVTGSTINNSLTATTASDALYLEAEGASTTANLTVTTSNFTAFRQNAIQTNAQSGARMTLNISGSVFKNTNAGVVNASNVLVFNGTGTNTFVSFELNGNTLTQGDGVSAAPSNVGRILTAGMINGAGTFHGKILNNTFGTTGVANSGGGGGADTIGFFAGGNNGASGGSRLLVQGNTIQQFGQAGIQIGAVDGNASIDATIQGNTIRQPGTAAAGAFAGIWAYAGNNPTDTNVLNIAIGSASVAGSKNTLTNSDPGNATDVYLGNVGVATAPINLSRVGSGSGTVNGAADAQINAVLIADNNAGLDITGHVGPINLVDTLPGLPPLLLAPSVNLPATEAPEDGTTVTVVDEDGVLSQAELDLLVTAAISRWESTGLTAEQSALLRSVTFEVANLAPRVLGQASSRHVTLDDDGAGLGWFVDATPLEDSEFVSPAGTVASRVDAMTTVMHELGHTLGLDDTYATNDSGSIMYGFLTLGARRAPALGQADGAVPNGDGTTDYAFSPYTIGTLPAGKSVTLNFAATVPTNTTATTVSAQGTITGTGGINVLTNDPDTVAANDATVAAIDLPDVTVAVSPASANEDSGTGLVYTFTRSGANDFARTINFSVSGSALFGTDYTQTGAASFAAASGTVTFAAGSATATVTLTPTADTTVESDETAVLTVTAGTGYDVGTTPVATGTIVNDDTSVSVAVSPGSVSEDGATNLVYTFTRTGVTSGALSVVFDITGTAEFGTDFVVTGASTVDLEGGTVTFAPGATVATITVNPTADSTVEPDETVVIGVVTDVGYTAGTPGNATGTITNDDADVTLSISPASVSEDGAPNLVYTFTRTGATSGTLTVNFTVGGTATFNTDYTTFGATSFTATTGTVTFEGGLTTATVTINPTADATAESDETTLLTLASGSGYNAITAGAVTGTIVDDDTSVTLAISPNTVVEDSAGTMVYTFTRTGNTASALTVNFAVGGTATFNTDYTQSGAATFTASAGTVTFAAGSATATVTLDPTTDSIVEADETTQLTVAAGAGYAVGTVGAVTGTITNDDTDIAVAVAPASVSEDGAGTLVYTFTRTGVTTGAITVNFSVGGTAAFGTDYTQAGATTYSAATGTVSFLAGETTKTVTIDPTADVLTEADETAILTVTAGTGYNIAGTAATGTIANDDATVSVAVSPASVAEDGAANLVYTFTRTGLLTSALTVDFTVGGSALFSTDYAQSGAATFTATAGTVTFAANSATATITIDPTADATAENDETAVITLAASGVGYTSTGTAATGTIANDDTLVTLAISPSATTSESTLTPLTYTFTRTGENSAPLVVNFTIGGTATLAGDYTLTSAAALNTGAGTITIPAGSASATMTFTPLNDGISEGNETGAFTVAAGAGYGVGTAGAVVATINDNDADLRITKTDGVTSVVAGIGTTYTIVVSNLSPTSVVGATVADIFPATFSNVTWTAVGAGGGTVTPSGIGNINELVNLPTGASVTFTVAGTVSASATGTLVNTATVTLPSGFTDVTPGDNTATDTDSVAVQANLAISKTDGLTTVVPGTNTTYTITVSNAGPSNIVGATVADVFPASFGGVTWTAVGAGGGDGVASGAGNINELVNLPVGGSITYTVTGSVNASATGLLSNTATIAAPSGATDPTPGNNTATDTDTLTPQSDLSISKTDGVNSLIPGTSTTYTITVSNSGPSNVFGATVADTFPATLSNVTWTAVGAGGATGAASGSGNINDLVNLPVGGSFTYTVTGTVSASATGLLSNTATIAAPGGVTDLTPGNNTATDTDTLTPRADLSLTKTGSADPVFVGNTLIYTITLTNSGASDALSVGINDTIPAGMSFVSATTPQGWVANTPSGATGTVSFTKSSVAAGAQETFTITVTADVSASGSTISNTAFVSSETSDPNSENNSATAQTFVGGVDLTLTKSNSVNATTTGATLVYALSYANTGSAAASGVVITETLPDGTSFVAGSNDGWVQVGSTNQYTFNVGALAAGASGTANFTVRVKDTVAAGIDNVDNTATIADDGNHGPDINGANNTATESDTLDAAPDLKLVVTDNGVTALRGQQVTYNITYSNVGNQDASGVFITQTVPANTFFSSGISTPGWTFVSGNTYTLNIGKLAAGAAEVTATFSVYVYPNIPGGYNQLETTGIVADDGANGADPKPANNTAGDNTVIYQGIYVVSPGVALPGRGAPPAIRVFDIATGVETQINAYEPSYRKSIRVATGDINGDGFDDIITSTITGNGRVRVFDGRTGERMTGVFSELAAFPEAGARGAYVASGDVDGDGRDDIIVGSGYKARGAAKVRVFSGFDGEVLTTQTPFGNSFRGGVRVATGDVDGANNQGLVAPRANFGNGVADIIASQGPGGNKVRITSGISNTVIREFTVGGPRYHGGVFVAAAADLDDDGRADLIVGRDRGRFTVVETFSGKTGALMSTITPFAPRYTLGARVAAADINLDGIADIIVGSGGRNASSVKVFDGTTGTEITAKAFTAFPVYPTGAVFVAGTSPVPGPQLT